MKENDLISVIVPIYNAEKYLDRCVQSIINQTYTNLEILLVNDGSTDNSKIMCEEYAKKDKRIKLINEKNGGPGSAKNAGIENATGKYIGFVDSDDYIEKDMYEVLYKLCIENDADVSMIDFKKVIDDKVIENKNSTGQVIVYDKMQAMKELLVDNKIKNYSWNKLFKRQVFENVRFKENCYYEDVDVTIKVFEKISKLVHKPVSKYYYVQRSGSIVNSKSYDKLKDFVKVTKERYNYIEKKYPEINEYNAIGFIANMVLFYKMSVVYDIDKLYKDFEENYELFICLYNKYQKQIYSELSNYRKVLLSIIVWDRELGKEVIKSLEAQIESNR